MHFPAAKDLEFDINRYLNPYIPRSRIGKLPRSLSRFLGYRDAQQQPIGNIPVALWSMLGGFCGTAILGGLFMADFIRDKGGPVIIGSFGAAAILEYNAIESPFSQPRNQIFGQFISAIIGVCITKLFALNDDFENLRWLAGAFSVGIASAAMTLTKTIHPPAGATALLAAVEPEISGLGWLFLGIVLLSSVITLAVSCLLNNIHRQYPIYWWSPQAKITKVVGEDAEKGKQDGNAVSTRSKGGTVAPTRLRQEITIGLHGVVLPEDFYLTSEERAGLQILEERLHDLVKGADGNHAEDNSSETEASQDSRYKG